MRRARRSSRITARASSSRPGAEIALVTIESLSGEPIEDVANTIFRAWGVGKKGKNEGIMLLLAIGDRRNRLEVGYGLEPILPDGFDGQVLREMRPALRQSQYGEALRAAAATIGSRIAESKGVTLDTSLRRRIGGGGQQESIPWPLLVIGLIVLFFILKGGGGGFLMGMLFGNLMGGGRRGGYGGGGGGFGGGGGGFGGFGGGDSGGGGASGSW